MKLLVNKEWPFVPENLNLHQGAPDKLTDGWMNKMHRWPKEVLFVPFAFIHKDSMDLICLFKATSLPKTVCYFHFTKFWTEANANIKQQNNVKQVLQLTDSKAWPMISVTILRKTWEPLRTKINLYVNMARGYTKITGSNGWLTFCWNVIETKVPRTASSRFFFLETFYLLISAPFPIIFAKVYVSRHQNNP